MNPSEPSLFFFGEKENDNVLYVCEYNTVQGLRLFDDHQKIVVRAANGGDLTSNDWMTQQHFEEVKNVKQLVQFLDNHSSLDLIDIEIEIEGFGLLSTHDDGECQFQSRNKDELMILLEKMITDRAVLPLQMSLLEHPNNYIEYHPSGNMVIHETFDDYLSSS